MANKHIEVLLLRRWFPDLPEEEMRRAEEVYIRYLDIRLRIYKRRVREENERLTEPQGKQALGEEIPSTDEDESPLPLAS